MQIEFVQHVSGTSIFEEFLAQHGDAVQHVAYLIEDADVCEARILSRLTHSRLPP
jgi:4-hydroxyphenylpyruvate dioxygenase-like putative hemolysin